ncbi:MAG: caspase family protein, partial [Planctomycetes bacterium]|nr:caspase family protein [Planctomycetota bacterium]
MKGLLAPFTVLALAAPLAAQVPAAAVGPAAPAVRSARALLVGCTEYPYLKEAGRVPGSNTIELLGPANDVELFARALREVYGVPDAAMTRLAGWPADPKARPTLQNIRQGFQRLAAQAQPGEWVVVYLAGHGSQQPSSSASLDDEPDGLDEIFLPADVRPAPDGAKVPNALVDDEIFELVGAIRAKGADVWLVVDACHSGTLLRGGGVRTRGLPPSALGLRGAAPRPVAGASAAPARPERTQGVAAFYGAQSFGAAPELELPEGARDAQPHGLFTYLLAAEMRRVGASATYGELIQRVIAAYQAFPCHLTIPMAQGDLDRAVGAGGRVADPPILLALRGDEIRADRGLLAGIEVGTVLAAVADGAPLDAEPVLELEV